MMNKDDLITGLEDGCCLGTNNHNLIMFNMCCMCFKKPNWPKPRQIMNGSEREERQEEIRGWKWMFKNSLYLKEQGSTPLRLYACII